MANKPVTVKTFSNRMEAEVAGAFLRANDIRFQIFADDAGGAYPFPLQPKQGVQLVVGSDDLAKAKELLSEQ